MKFSFNKRKLQYGSASLLFIILFVAVVIVLNIFVDFLTDRFSLKLDMTESGQFTLSDDTKELLKSLSADVNIYILSTRAEMENDSISKGALDTIQRYNSESGNKVKYEFVDPYKNPQFFKKYPKAKNTTEKALVIEGPERYLVVESGKFIYRMTGNTSNKTYNQAEELLSSAILHVSSEVVCETGFVTGHGEQIPGTLFSIFEGNNFGMHEKVDLLSEIPATIKNLVISAPTSDYTAEEIVALEKYLSVDGNNLFVFWSMDSPELVTLERYLSEWGVSFTSYLVCDQDNSYLSAATVLADIPQNPVINGDDIGQLYILSPSTRPINLLWEEKGFKKSAQLLRSRSSSYAKLISSENKISSLSRETDDLNGPFALATITEARLGNSGNDGVSRVIAFGTFAFAIDDVTSISRCYNSSVLSKIVDYANPNTNTMVIRPKVTSTYDLNITEAGNRVLNLVLIYVIPALLIAVGIFVFIKRRNK